MGLQSAARGHILKLYVIKITQYFKRLVIVSFLVAVRKLAQNKGCGRLPMM